MRKKQKEGKSEAVTPVALAQANPNRAPDPFIERIGSGYAECTFREQWAELEALLREDLRRARLSRRSGRNLGPEERPIPGAADRAEERIGRMAALMSCVFERLENIDYILRDAADEILAGEGTETCIPYGHRTLQDHWAQLTGRLRADIQHIRFACVYGRLGLVPDQFRKSRERIAADVEEHLRDANMLMKHIVSAEIEATDELLENAGADFLAYRHRSTRSAAQKKSRSQKATRATT